MAQPALFFIDGDTPQAQEYASLKGQFDALEQAAIQKDCSLTLDKNLFVEVEQQRKEETKESQVANQ